MKHTLAPLEAVKPAYVNISTYQAQPKPLHMSLNMMSVSGRNPALDGPHFSFINGLSSADILSSKDDGFSAMQSHLLLPQRIKSFKAAEWLCTHAAITNIKKLKRQVKRWKKRGFICATIIVGTGNESYSEATYIAQAIDEISEKNNFPLFLELHRASVTENIPTVLAMLSACPSLRLNADFSHYMLSYRLDQLNNQQLLETLILMQPIFKRVGYFHGRYANSTAVQTSTPGDRAAQIYLILIDQVFQYFKRQQSVGDVLFFAAELLPPFTAYAQIDSSTNGHTESSDRYQQSLTLNKKVQALFDNRENELTELTTSTSATSDNNLIIDINTEDDFEQLQNPKLDRSEIIRIRLGNYLLTCDSQRQQLIQSFIKFQHTDNRIVLETARNTLTHNPELTQALLLTYPTIELSLNPSEWILAKEITPTKLSQLQRPLKQLMPNCRVKPEVYATAEQQYDASVKYKLSAFISISVLIECLYRRFYKHFMRQ